MRTPLREFEMHPHTTMKCTILIHPHTTMKCTIVILLTPIKVIPGTNTSTRYHGIYLGGFGRGAWCRPLEAESYVTRTPIGTLWSDLCLDAVACEGSVNRSRLHFFRYTSVGCVAYIPTRVRIEFGIICDSPTLPLRLFIMSHLICILELMPGACFI